MARVNSDRFTKAKERASKRLDALQHACKKCEESLSLVDTRDVQEKVARVRDRLQQEVFHVAFFGAFGDGKSTIIASLTGALDIPISVEPTTDRVECYRHGDWMFVDTPGTSSVEPKHDKKSRSYISEADLVVFVVNAVNPLPLSQEELVRWMLVEIGKEPHVIFAINRMDEVADLEDEADFEHHAKVKRRTLLQTLHSICGRPCEPAIVAISADPYEEGVEDWMDNPEEYKSLSKIENLITAIEEHLHRASEQIQANAGMASVRDGIETILDRLEELYKNYQPYHEALAQRVKELIQDRDRLDQLVNETYSGVQGDVDTMRRTLLDDLDACLDQRALKNLIERDIGKNGEILERMITTIVERWGQTLTGQAKPIFDQIITSMEDNDSLFGDLIKRGGPKLAEFLRKAFGGNPRQIADGILRLRDTLKIPIKFKPWRAIRLAKYLKKVAWLAPLIEGLPVLVDIIRERRLASEVAKLKEVINQGLEEFFKTFTRDEFEQQAIPALSELRQMAMEQETNLKEVKKILWSIEDAIFEFRNLRRHGWE